MCGRYTLVKNVAQLFQQLAIEFPAEIAEPRRYNVAPSQPILAIVADPHPRVEFLEWGFIPTWARPGAGVHAVINARAESVIEGKPYFRGAFRSARCVLLADGFYEWKKERAGKRPFRICLRDGSVFAMAGLWSSPHLSDGAEHPTGAVITVEPNELMRPIHDRMPAILHLRDVPLWLDPTARDRELIPLLVPFPAEEMTAYEVGTIVNNPRNDTPECIEPVNGSNLFGEAI